MMMDLYFNDEVILETNNGFDERGQEIKSSPIFIKCRILEKSKLMYDSFGKQFQSTYQIYCTDEVKLGDRITVGQESYPVKQISSSKMIGGETICRKLIL